MLLHSPDAMLMIKAWHKMRKAALLPELMLFTLWYAVLTKSDEKVALIIDLIL